MFRVSILKNIFSFLLLASVIFPQSVFAYDITTSMDVTITAQVNAESSGGGGSGGINLPTIVNFSGMAYPLSKVYILKDGKVAVITIADQAANFSVSLTGLSTNAYTFSVYGEDSSNRKSSYFTFPIYITEGTTVNIGNIFLSPTIDIDKSEVKKGDNLLIFGQSVPKNEVVISVHSNPEYFFKVLTNAMGAYLYNLDTSILDLGQHVTKSKVNISTQESQYATPVTFSVGEENTPNNSTNCSLLRGDLNCDGQVNLIDFSIMAYWYKKPNFPKKIDLNNDGKITLADFSIMVFNWTD
jgi:hypothetical protein